MYVLVTNFGDPGVALLQWAHEQQLQNVVVLSVETGWAAAAWAERVQQCHQLATRYGFQHEHLAAPADFSRVVQQKGEYPSEKFQWCAGILKGIPLNDWLDAHDSQATATMVLPKMRLTAGPKLQPEMVENDYFGYRACWHPFCDYQQAEVLALLAKTGIPALGHRSLECEPCVNCRLPELARLSASDVSKVVELEQAMQQAMFGYAAAQGIAAAKAEAERVAHRDTTGVVTLHGCGSPFGCGE